MTMPEIRGSEPCPYLAKSIPTRDRSAARQQPWVHGWPLVALSVQGRWESASILGEPWRDSRMAVVELVNLSVLPFPYLKNWESNSDYM